MSCFSILKGHQLEPVIVLVIGLDNAGKSSLLLRLRNEPGIPLPSGWGFSVENIQFNMLPDSLVFRRCRPRRSIVPLRLYDVGGDVKIRGIWKNYIAEAHAVVYIVDSSERLEESKKALHEIYNEEMLYGKPLLIISNKRDLPTTLTPESLFDKLELSSLFPNSNVYSNEYDVALPFRIQDCTLNYLQETNESIDGRIKAGIRWLLDSVQRHRIGLDARRRQDMQVEKMEKSVKKGRVIPEF